MGKYQNGRKDRGQQHADDDREDTRAEQVGIGQCQREGHGFKS